MVMLEGMAEHLRLESGALQADCRAVALAGVLDTLALELAPAARRGRIAMKMARTDVAVSADPVLLTRILRNLVTNALLHSRGTRLRVLVRRRTRVEIVVIDDGSAFLRAMPRSCSCRTGKGQAHGVWDMVPGWVWRSPARWRT